VWSVSTREVDLAHKPEPRHLSYNPALNVHTQKQSITLSHYLLHQMGITAEWQVLCKYSVSSEALSQGLDLKHESIYMGVSHLQH